jgi:hypothetical protein
VVHGLGPKGPQPSPLGSRTSETLATAVATDVVFSGRMEPSSFSDLRPGETRRVFVSVQNRGRVDVRVRVVQKWIDRAGIGRTSLPLGESIAWPLRPGEERPIEVPMRVNPEGITCSAEVCTFATHFVLRKADRDEPLPGHSWTTGDGPFRKALATRITPTYTVQVRGVAFRWNDPCGHAPFESYERRPTRDWRVRTFIGTVSAAATWAEFTPFRSARLHDAVEYPEAALRLRGVRHGSSLQVGAMAEMRGGPLTGAARETVAWSRLLRVASPGHDRGVTIQNLVSSCPSGIHWNLDLDDVVVEMELAS